MLNLYLILGNSSILKSIVFLDMAHFLQKHKQLEQVMIRQVQEIHNLSTEWYLTKEERIDLYVKCAKILDDEGDSTGAFKVYYQAFKLLNTMGTKENQKRKTEAEQLVVAALKSPEIINIEEVMLLDGIKELKSQSKDIYALVEMVVDSDISKFNAGLDKYKKLMEQHKLQRDLLEEKKRFILICNLDIEESTGRVLKFSELAKMLNLKVDDIEEWVIQAIANDIIDARIDQIKDEVIIKNHKLRNLSKEEWLKVKAKVGTWKQKFTDIQQVIAHQPGE